MECMEVRVDTRIKTPEEIEIGKRNAELAFELNHTMPMTERYMEILHELFVQVVTVVFMTGVIVLAVFLGHRLRDLVDRKKSAKAEKE